MSLPVNPLLYTARRFKTQSSHSHSLASPPLPALIFLEPSPAAAAARDGGAGPFDGAFAGGPVPARAPAGSGGAALGRRENARAFQRRRQRAQPLHRLAGNPRQ